MYIKRKSRAELNRDLRRILTRHHVDMTKLVFSASRTGVKLSGILKTLSGDELSPGKMESLTELLRKHFGQIDSDLSNWEITDYSFKKKQVKKIYQVKKSS
jgi:hypothetical protein